MSDEGRGRDGEKWREKRRSGPLEGRSSTPAPLILFTAGSEAIQGNYTKGRHSVKVLSTAGEPLGGPFASVIQEDSSIKLKVMFPKYGRTHNAEAEMSAEAFMCLATAMLCAMSVPESELGQQPRFSRETKGILHGTRRQTG